MTDNFKKTKKGNLLKENLTKNLIVYTLQYYYICDNHVELITGIIYIYFHSP